MPLGKYRAKEYSVLGVEQQPDASSPDVQARYLKKGVGDLSLLKEADTSNSSRRAATTAKWTGGIRMGQASVTKASGQSGQAWRCACIP